MIAPEWLKQGKYWLVVCTEDVFEELKRTLHLTQNKDGLFETKDFEVRVVRSLRSVKKNMVDSEKTVVIVKVVQGKHSCYIERLQKEEEK